MPRRAGNADPRTKLALLIVLGILAVTPGPAAVNAVIVGLCAIALAWLRRWGMLTGFALAYFGLSGVGAGLVLTGNPVATTIGVGLLVAARYTVPVGLALVFYASTRGSELIAALRAMKVPEALVLPTAVTYRFIPTVAAEGQAIIAAIRLRGGSRLGPLTALEYVFAPLITSVLRIGEELTAASLTRGLGARTPATGARVRPTTIATIGFTAADLLWIALGAVPVALRAGAWLSN